MIKSVNDKALERYLQASERPVLVSFTQIGIAGGLDAAREAALVYQGQLDVVELNIDENPSIAGSLGVNQGPTLVLLDQGHEIARLDDHEDPQWFFSFVEQLLNEV